MDRMVGKLDWRDSDDGGNLKFESNAVRFLMPSRDVVQVETRLGGLTGSILSTCY